MISQTGLETIALDVSLPPKTLRLLLYMCSHLDFENYLVLRQADIGKKLGMRVPHVSRAVKQLVDRGYLIKGQKIGNINSYRLNPRYGYKGKARNLKRDREGDIYIYRPELDGVGVKKSACG